MAMATSPRPQDTDFTRDVLGRYVCNGFDEATRSTDTTVRADARPFDVVIVGGGSFGAAVAQHLFFNDTARRHRILVLEFGPLVLPEHVQNLPMLGLDVPGPIQNDPGVLRNEVSGLPWRSATPFTGLAYCLGGRSVFFGGWSPQLLDTQTDTEMPRTRWPQAVVDDLNQRYFAEASEQIGTDVINDFISGPLHRALRQQLFNGINTVTDAIKPAELPLHLKGIPAAERDLNKLEAPLAVQAKTRPGLFPINKFSSVPLLIKAARQAQSDSGGDDVKKRLMIVPFCHVKRLRTVDGRVTAVETAAGDVPIPPTGVVIVALGTIESARLALLSFQDNPNYAQIGSNLMAHLRSNLTIRIPRTALAQLDPNIKELAASALFVKGRHHYPDHSTGYFHLQITAAGLNTPSTDSEAELFKKIPDIDTFHLFKAATDDKVVITIRGIGQMEAANPASHVQLPANNPEFDQVGVQRAVVTLTPSQNDQDLWNAMDQAADDVAKVFAGGLAYEVLTKNTGLQSVNANQPAKEISPFLDRRDVLGTTHHEAGPLWTGDDPTTSVTNPNAHFHHVANAYAIGPALHPTVGSPNPMLTGVALARRLGDHLTAPQPYQPDPGFTALFDGITTANWRMAGRGSFIAVDDALEAIPGDDIGLFWCTNPTPPNFILKLEWLRTSNDDNSGVLVRFPNPDSKGYLNTAYVGVHFGFEVQIDELGAPDGADLHKTGAIYNEPNQAFALRPARPVGQWNQYEIRVQDQTYTVFLNGNQVTSFTFHGDPNRPDRGLPSTPNAPRFIGLQAHPGAGRVMFRNLQLQPL